MNPALDLLKSITRDPGYVRRMQESDSSSMAKSWDNRFTVAKMPHYDAVNDRFCKFNLRRRKANETPAPKRSKLAANMLNMMGSGPKPVWGDINPREPLPPLTHKAHETPNPLASLNQASHPATTDRVPDAVSIANIVPQGQSLEVLFSKGRQRVIKLWDELGVPELDRLQFAKQHMSTPTAENVQALNDEIQRLLDRRNAAVQVEKAIEIREGFLYLLQELSDRYATTGMEKERAIRELNALVVPFRNASLDVVDAILKWRDVQKASTMKVLPYLWKGVSYLHKMVSDAYFLTFSRLGQLLDFDLRNNPLLDPRKELELAQAGKLPPVRRQKDNVRLKDLPRERMDRAERVLAEEAQRQATLNASRTNHGSAHDGMAYVEEEGYLENLVREEEEKQQLLVEEDVWLSAHEKEEQNRGKEERAAVKIQTCYRGYIARKLVTAKLTQKKAAIKMQTLARQFVAKLYTQRLRKQTLAAKRIQALHRGVSTRTAIGEIRHRHYCATTIQRVYRGHIGRKIADMMRYIRHCAVSIQRVYKGYRVRKAVQYFQSKMLAHHATTIQRCWRGYLVRRNPFYNPRKIEKVVTLQAWTRGNIDRAFAKQLLRRKRAAVKLQAWWRSVTAQRLASQLRSNRVDRGWQHRLRLATTAAILLQSAWRRFLACRRTAKLRAERNDTAAARALLAIAEEERREAERRQFLSSCATKIQAGWRGLQGRNTVKMIRYLSSLATKIQKVVRGRLGRLRAKARNLEYIRELSAMSAVPPEESLVSSTLALLGEREAQPLSQLTPVAEVIDPVEEAPEPLPPHSLEEPVVEDQRESAHDAKVEVESAQETSTVGAEPNVDGKNAQPTTDAPSAVELAPQEEVFPVLPNAPEAVTDDAEKKNEAATTITNFLKTAANRNEVSRKESRKRKAAASLNQQARHQEAVYAATIIARWVRNVFLRRQLAASAKRQEIELASKAHLQEKVLAACGMQNLVRRFILRRKLQAQKESMTFAAYRQALLQERQTGAVLIQALARRASARNLAAVAPKRDSHQNRAEQQERDYAAAVVQHAVLLHIPHIAAREKTISESTSVTAIAESQERSYAIKSLQHFLRRIQAKNAILNLRKQRAIFVSQLDALAAIQESEFASPTTDAADDSTVSPPASSSAAVTTPLVSPERRPSRSVINVTHAHKGQEVHVGFSPEQIAAAEHEHKVLPKDAPVRPQDVSESETDPEQELRERIRALEEKLAEMRRAADAEIKAEVDRRLREALAAQQQEIPAREPVTESPAVSYPSSPEPASMAVSPACTSPQPAVVEPQSHFQQESTLTQPSSQDVESEPAPTVVVAPIPVAADELPREQPVHEDVTAVAVQEQEEVQPSVENFQSQAGDSEVPATDGTSTSAEEVHPEARSEPVSATVQPAETHQTQSEVEVTSPVHEEINEAAPTTEVVEAHHSAEPQPVTENNAAEAAVHNEEPVAVVPEGKSTEESAVAIQSLYRGHLDRRRVASTKAEKKQARAAQEKEAAVRIQCGYRQHTARNRFAAQKAKVQHEREEKRLEAERQLAAQETHAKQADAAAKEKLRTQIENQSAAVIQRAYRCYNARFMLRWKKMERREQRERAAAEEEQRLTSNAAVKIQCFSRQATARTAVKELRRQRIKEHQAKATLEEIKHSAAITIQCAWRSYNARFELKCRRDRKLREQQDLEEARKKAEEDELARIQREEEERRLQEQQSKATLTMQLAWRSYNARFRREELQRQKSEKDEFILKSTSLEILQRLGRGALSRSQLARSYSEYLEAKLLQEQSDRLSSVAQPVGRAYFARAELGYQRQAAMLPGTTALNAIEEAIREASPEREHKSEPAPSTESQ